MTVCWPSFWQGVAAAVAAYCVLSALAVAWWLHATRGRDGVEP
jgi:hypothetical protein